MQNINKISFNKNPKTSEELIQQLQDRGMIIEDEIFVKDILSKVNYYRLSGYWFKHQYKYIKEKVIKIICNKEKEGEKIFVEEVIDNLKKINIDLTEEIIQDIRSSFDGNNVRDLFNDKLDDFFNKITFKNVVDIYKFDSKLRSLCFDALEKIEISISTVLCNHMCQTKGAYWFLDKNNINTKIYTKKKKDGTTKKIIIFSHDKLIEQIGNDIEKNNKATFIKSFYSKYNNDFPPYWIISQIITFGTISKIYATLPKMDIESIARNLNVTRKFLEKSLISLSYIRNICAHYSRLWDKEYSLTPGDINFKINNRNNIYNYSFNSFSNNASFFHVFYTIALFLKILYPESKWVTLVTKKIEEYQPKTNGLVSFEKMGFPEGWKELPLIKEMLKNVYKV